VACEPVLLLQAVFPLLTFLFVLGADERETELLNEDRQLMEEDEINVNVEMVDVNCLSHGPK